MKKSKTNKSLEKRIRVSEDLLWGIHPVNEALLHEPERVSEVILNREHHGKKRQDIVQLAKSKGIKVTFVQSFSLIGAETAAIRHQGVLAKMSQSRLLPFADLLDTFSSLVAQGKNPRLIVLDSLQDPHNLGAIIRSAHASGMDGVLLTRERSAPLGGTAAKSSAGAISHINICQVTNLTSALQSLKKVGAWVFGAVKESESQSVFQTDFNLPACIVVGSEGVGVRPLVRKQCDVLVSIPMVGELDSLNSSVAAGVIMFEMLRQRTTS